MRFLMGRIGVALALPLRLRAPLLSTQTIRRPGGGAVDAIVEETSYRKPEIRIRASTRMPRWLYASRVRPDGGSARLVEIRTRICLHIFKNANRLAR